LIRILFVFIEIISFFMYITLYYYENKKRKLPRLGVNKLANLQDKLPVILLTPLIISFEYPFLLRPGLF